MMAQVGSSVCVFCAVLYCAVLCCAVLTDHRLPPLPAADNGSGGDESAAVKRQRMGADSSSGEGSGAGPPGEDVATAMLTTDSINDARMGDTAGPAQAAPAQPQCQQQQQQQPQPQHVAKDPMKLHSPPSTGDLQEEGGAPPAVKRTRNP